MTAAAMHSDSLIESSWRLALYFARRVRIWPELLDDVDQDDIDSLALFTTVKAASYWKPARGTWSSFLSVCIRRACFQFLRRARDRVLWRARPVVLDSGEEVDAVDLLEDDRPGPEELADPRVLAEQLLRTLDRRSVEVLRLRYGIDGNSEHSLKEIGEALGLAWQRVQQIEYSALKRLRRKIDGRQRRADLSSAGLLEGSEPGLTIRPSLV